MAIVDKLQDTYRSDTTPLHQTSAPPDEPDTTLPQSELFIRTTMAQNPAEGCTLLFRLYYSAMCSHAVRFVYSRQVAEDLVSDVFYTFWNTQAFRNVTTSYRAYLFSSVRNRAFNYLKHELKKADPLESIDQQQATAASELPEQMMQFDELYHKIDELVNSLSPQCRKVFLLNRFEGQKPKEIAQHLQLSVRTVEVHIAKALATLRQGLKNQWIWLIMTFWQSLDL